MNLVLGTDAHWEKWGKNNPYYGVVSHNRFLNENLTADSIREFFLSGEKHVDHVFAAIRSKIKPDFSPDNILDYGCGVGRLLIPFAKRASGVTGVDVSPSMLLTARQNCDKYDLKSVSLLRTSDMASLPSASFDLVHSFIVFQHIPTKRGEAILHRLIDLVKMRGVGAIQVLYKSPQKGLPAIISAMRNKIPPVQWLMNVIKGRAFLSPQMQMNCYSMNRLFSILQNAGCFDLHVEFSDHAGYLGAMIYFEKSSRRTLFD